MRKYLPPAASPAPPVQRERRVCFACRKMFRPCCVQQNTAENAVELLCPDCRKPMRRVGRYFKPPRRRDVKQWEKVRLLVEGGVDFYGYAPRPPKRLNEVDRTSKGERLLQAIARKTACRRRQG